MPQKKLDVVRFQTFPNVSGKLVYVIVARLYKNAFCLEKVLVFYLCLLCGLNF